jgi:hypothetical protein
MLLQNRVIYKDDAVYTDYSRELSDLTAGTLPLVIAPADDAIYIGSDLPFNHRYFQMSVNNAVTGSVSVSIWDGSAFTPAVDVIDLTDSGGAPFAQDGVIMWSTDQDSAWSKEYSTENIPQLSSFKIYNCYWVKLTFSAAFTPTISYVGHKFAKDADLATYYGDLNRATVRESFFEVATANWNTVHVTAAEEIVRDLRASKVIDSVNQILEPEIFRDAAIHKLAEIVYSSFGPSHADRVDFAVNKYKDSMNKLVFNVDKNKNGKLDSQEKIREFKLYRR